MTRKTKIIIAAVTSLLFVLGILIGVGIALIINNANKPANSTPTNQAEQNPINNPNPESQNPPPAVNQDGLILFQADSDIYTSDAKGNNIQKTLLKQASTLSAQAIDTNTIGYGYCEPECGIFKYNLTTQKSEIFLQIPKSSKVISLDWAKDSDTIAYLVLMQDGTEQAYIKQVGSEPKLLKTYAKRDFGRGAGYGDQQKIVITADAKHIIVVNTFEPVADLSPTMNVYKADGTNTASLAGSQVTAAFTDRFYFKSLTNGNIYIFDFETSTGNLVMEAGEDNFLNPQVSPNNKYMAYWEEQTNGTYKIKKYEFAPADTTDIIQTGVVPIWTSNETIVYSKTIDPMGAWMGYKVGGLELIDIYGNNSKTLTTAQDALVLDALPIGN